MRVCVIGAGISGLPAIKECLEAGLDVVAYEKTAEVGGLWNYRPELKEGGTVMKSTVVNTSKEMMAYSDFPPPKHYPNFMHNSLVQKYLEGYVRLHELDKHIRFCTSVKKLTKVGKKWIVEIENGQKEEFDFAMLCTGHHSIPSYPNIKGLERFKGRVLHSHEYRDYHGFENKNVFIIGIGNSSLDIAVELAKISKSVTISTRRGTWIFNRVSQGGMPYDVKLMTRYYEFLMNIVPWSVVNDFMEYRLQERMDHDVYGLRPNHRFFEQHPSLNDFLPNLLASGSITITEHVQIVDETGVFVKNGRRFPADIIVLATGYTFAFPYLDPESVIPIKDHFVELYKYVFPLNYPSLAVIGLIQPIGSIAPISEMQSRWAVSVFTGRVQLPEISVMRDDILYKKNLILKRYYTSPKHTLQVDYIKYMDEIATLIGCMPDFKKYITDPRLLLRLLIGANAPYVYRLNGNGKWVGARDALMTLTERVKAPLKNRECKISAHKERGTLDEYFRYVSLKMLCCWGCILFFSGLCATWFTPVQMSPFMFILFNILYLIVFSLLLIWFDFQYDMASVV